MIAAALAAVIAAVSFALFEPVTAMVASALGWAMLAVAIFDLRRLIVPDMLSLPAIPAGILVNWTLPPAGLDAADLWAPLLSAVAGGALFYLVRQTYEKWRGRSGLGLGDVKLAAAAGAWCPGMAFLYVVLLAALAGLAWSGARAALRGGGLAATTVIPFGAFLAPAIWLVWSLTALGWVSE